MTWCEPKQACANSHPHALFCELQEEHTYLGAPKSRNVCDCNCHCRPQKSRSFRDKRLQCHIAMAGCDGNRCPSLTLQSLLFSIPLLFLFSDFPCFFRVFFPSFSKDFKPRREKPLLFSGFPLFFFKKSKGWRVRVAIAFRAAISEPKTVPSAGTLANWLWQCQNRWRLPLRLPGALRYLLEI